MSQCPLITWSPRSLSDVPQIPTPPIQPPITPPARSSSYLHPQSPSHTPPQSPSHTPPQSPSRECPTSPSCTPPQPVIGATILPEPEAARGQGDQIPSPSPKERLPGVPSTDGISTGPDAAEFSSQLMPTQPLPATESITTAVVLTQSQLATGNIPPPVAALPQPTTKKKQRRQTKNVQPGRSSSRTSKPPTKEVTPLGKVAVKK